MTKRGQTRYCLAGAAIIGCVSVVLLLFSIRGHWPSGLREITQSPVSEVGQAAVGRPDRAGSLSVASVIPAPNGTIRADNEAIGRHLAGRADQTPAPPAKVVRQPTWPQVTPSWQTLRQLPDHLLQRVQESPVPVLVPLTAVERALLMIHPTGYTYTVDQVEHEVQLSVIGEAIAYEVEGSPTSLFNDRVRDRPATSGASEVGWYLTWEEFGVSYLVLVGCGRRTAPYCSLDYARDVAERLVYIGGKGRER